YFSVMSTLMSMGPMLVVDNQNSGPMYHGPHHMNPGPPPPNGGPMLTTLGPTHNSISQAAPSSGQPALMTSSMNRSQRCGVCRGCQCKPCGQCTYCQDSPQFGGPGVKKQSCIERRCLRVLENRLQRDAPTFKARVGCNQCEDCRMPDCQICLVCLDKRFFDNRYMTGAMCAKKRCNNATSIELPAAQNAELRQAHKRTYDQSGPPDYQMLKRRAPPGMEHMSPQQQQQRLMGIAPQGVLTNAQGAPLYPGGPLAQQQQLRLLQSQMPPHPAQLLIPHPGAMIPISSSSGAAISSPLLGDNLPSGMVHLSQAAPFIPQGPYLMAPTFTQTYFDDSAPLADPFIPPSYAPEMKNAVVLQPL
uniref:CXXC-type domain-containing protein n=2 Tax=Parascaris univalens TaxID=6257 RepID=A0A915C7M5_PARUN